MSSLLATQRIPSFKTYHKIFNFSFEINALEIFSTICATTLPHGIFLRYSLTSTRYPPADHAHYLLNPATGRLYLPDSENKKALEINGLQLFW
jgi:hypothetical protein